MIGIVRARRAPLRPARPPPRVDRPGAAAAALALFYAVPSFQRSLGVQMLLGSFFPPWCSSLAVLGSIVLNLADRGGGRGAQGYLLASIYAVLAVAAGRTTAARAAAYRAVALWAPALLAIGWFHRPRRRLRRAAGAAGAGLCGVGQGPWATGLPAGGTEDRGQGVGAADGQPARWCAGCSSARRSSRAFALLGGPGTGRSGCCR